MGVFGILMFVLDFPIPHKSANFASIHNTLYRFMLFMTRFTGRGLFYTFLGTMIFAALYDLNISWLFGVVLGGYVGCLGVITSCYGVHLSRKLDSVRIAIIADNDPKKCPDRGFSRQGFREMARQVSRKEFSDDELDYIFNGLSFTPVNEGVIMPDEFLFWISPGH